MSCISETHPLMTRVSISVRVIQCTRWAELVAGLQFLTELSEALGAPSEIRLLNGADPVMVGLGDDNGEGLTFATEAFHESPGGQTPLCQHINAVVSSLTSVAPELKRLNKKAVVIICTDGEATDGDVAAAMRPLKQVPSTVHLDDEPAIAIVPHQYSFSFSFQCGLCYGCVPTRKK